VWNDVLDIEDPVGIDYTIVEEMFSRKVEEQVVKTDVTEKKKPTEVIIYFCLFLFSCLDN